MGSGFLHTVMVEFSFLNFFSTSLIIISRQLACYDVMGHICDVIKPNESDLAIIDFEIQPIIAFNLILI